MTKQKYSEEEQIQYEKNIKDYSISTGQNPTKHGRTPLRIFDPGKGDPWRELHLVDADNCGVTTLGPLMDPTGMSLGNALFIMKCCNEHDDLVMTVGQLEAEVDRLRKENEQLQAKLTEILNEV